MLFVHDLTRTADAAYAAGEASIAARLAEAERAGRVVHVHNKADLAGAPPGVLALSARTGAGLQALRRRLLERAGWHAEGSGSEGVFIARARHDDALRRTREHLALARERLDAAEPALELLAEELRLAHECLGEITGRFGVEDLLGAIFGRFCIGK